MTTVTRMGGGETRKERKKERESAKERLRFL